MANGRIRGKIAITLSEPANNFSFVIDPEIQAMVSAVQDTPLPGKPESTVPYFADDAHGVALYQADALELLPRFAAESFDLIFADPPYFLSGDGMTCQAGKMVSVHKGKWDTPTTFAAMHEFNRTWLSLCRRLLKPNGTLWVTGTNHNIYSVGFALQELDFKILNDIAWYKVNPPPNLACRYFTHATETILWARKEVAARHYFDYAAMKQENGGKQMQSLWHIKPPAPIEKRHGKHPTQKPEALLERILRAASRPGDTVLDPFCGSGTTGVACARLERGFVGIEQELEYLHRAEKRLKEAMSGAIHAILIVLPVPRLALLQKETSISWADRVTSALQTLGGEGHLNEINRVIEQSPNPRQTRTWTSTVRRVVRQSPRFEPIGKGRYRLLNQLVLRV